MVKISPSILTADFLELKGVVRQLEDAGVEMLHIDVMDGDFVPNISIGFPVIDSLARHTKLPLDVHLMIQRPQLYIENGTPKCLLCACMEDDALPTTYSIRIPLK